MIDREYPKMLYKRDPAGKHILQTNRYRERYAEGAFDVVIADNADQEAGFAAEGFFTNHGDASEAYKKAINADNDKAAGEAVATVGKTDKAADKDNKKPTDQPKTAWPK